jgi:hypothetical protein
MAVARQEDGMADLATPAELFGDVPEDVFRLRPAQAGQRRVAPQTVPLPQSAPVPQAAAALERYSYYTNENAPAGGAGVPLPAESDGGVGSWLWREWLGVRWLCRRLLSRRPVASAPTSLHVSTSHRRESQEVPSC